MQTDSSCCKRSIRKYVYEYFACEENSLQPSTTRKVEKSARPTRSQHHAQIPHRTLSLPVTITNLYPTCRPTDLSSVFRGTTGECAFSANKVLRRYTRQIISASLFASLFALHLTSCPITSRRDCMSGGETDYAPWEGKQMGSYGAGAGAAYVFSRSPLAEGYVWAQDQVNAAPDCWLYVLFGTGRVNP